MTGRIKYIGESKGFHVPNKDRCEYVKKNEYITLPIDQCVKLWNRGIFEPDKSTLNNIEKNINPNLGEEISGKYKGRCFLLGSGESMNGFDYSLLDNEFTIGFNHGYKIYNNLNVLLFVDGNLVKTDYDRLRELNCMLFAAGRAHYRDFRSNVFHFPINNTKPQHSMSKGLYNGHLSGLAGINLALIMGFEQIYLLGFDMSGGRVKEYESPKTSKYHISDWQENKLKMFDTYLPYKDKIYNCNKDSNIKIFQYSDIDKVLNETK